MPVFHVKLGKLQGCAFWENVELWRQSIHVNYIKYKRAYVIIISILYLQWITYKSIAMGHSQQPTNNQP